MNAEQPCKDYGRDPRDPTADPEHDFEYIGSDADGHTYYKCRKCSAEYDQ